MAATAKMKRLMVDIWAFLALLISIESKIEEIRLKSSAGSMLEIRPHIVRQVSPAVECPMEASGL